MYTECAPGAVMRGVNENNADKAPWSTWNEKIFSHIKITRTLHFRHLDIYKLNCCYQNLKILLEFFALDWVPEYWVAWVLGSIIKRCQQKKNKTESLFLLSILITDSN